VVPAPYSSAWDGASVRNGVAVWDLAAFRYLGPAGAAARALEGLGDGGLEGVWIHHEVGAEA